MIQPFCQPPDEDGAAADFERVKNLFIVGVRRAERQVLS